MSVTRKYKRPAPLDIVDYITTGFRMVITFPTLDVSTFTYSAAIKDRKDTNVLVPFIVVSDASSVTLTLSKAAKAVLTKQGDFYWDLLEKTPTIPDGSLLFSGSYSLVEAATES